MKPGLYTNDKGTSVVFASHVGFQDKKPTFVEYYRVKPRIEDDHWGRDADDFLKRWPHYIEEVEILKGNGPAKDVTPGLYSNGVGVAWVTEVETRDYHPFESRHPVKEINYVIISSYDNLYTVTRTEHFLKMFPYRVTEIEAQDHEG
jgi:hypothetical protein